MIKVGFRADGGDEVGMGHIMRSIALAGELEKLDCRAIFFIRPHSGTEKLLKQCGYQVEVVPTSSRHAELCFLRQIFQQEKIEIIITDSYEIDREYLCEVYSFVQVLVSIDDFNRCPYPSHLVINGNLYAQNLNYQSTTDDTDWLLGAKYTFLREEFLHCAKPEVNKQVRQVLITLGGSDSENMTPLLLKSLEKVPGNFGLQVVIGPGYTNIDDIVTVVKEVDRTCLLVFHVKNMGELMVRADLCISAGGSTLHELTFLGIPTLVIPQAANQIPVVDFLEKKGVVLSLGSGKNFKNNFETIILEMLTNHDKRRMMSENGRKLIDGLGCQRVAKRIVEEFFRRQGKV